MILGGATVTFVLRTMGFYGLFLGVSILFSIDPNSIQPSEGYAYAAPIEPPLWFWGHRTIVRTIPPCPAWPCTRMALFSDLHTHSMSRFKRSVRVPSRIGQGGSCFRAKTIPIHGRMAAPMQLVLRGP